MLTKPTEINFEDFFFFWTLTLRLAEAVTVTYWFTFFQNELIGLSINFF